jgi:hypothetical protein
MILLRSVRFLLSALVLIMLLLGNPNTPWTHADTLFLPVVQTDESAAVTTAAAGSTWLVQTTPGVALEQLCAAHPLTIIETLPALALYRLVNVGPALYDCLRADPRVLVLTADSTAFVLEAQHTQLNGSSNEFEMLQRFFGYGSGDTNTLFESINIGQKPPKKGRQAKGHAPQVELVFVAPKAVNLLTARLEREWRDWGQRAIKLEKVAGWHNGAGIIVAILDTGVDLTHPALVQHLLPGYDFVDNDALPDDSIDGVDEDADGVVDEGAGHGTHIAGIIAQVAPGAQLLPVRVLNSDGGGNLFDIVAGIVFAVDQGAQVINLSLRAQEDSPLLRAALRYAAQRQVLVVASAAGDETGLDYPAAYAEAIAVGAIGRDYFVADFSKPYAEMVDLFAPGILIYSTYRDGQYAWWSGTSMAAPFVSGAAAIFLSSGQCPADCTRTLMVNEVDPVRPNIKHSGSLNLEKILKRLTR